MRGLPHRGLPLGRHRHLAGREGRGPCGRRRRALPPLSLQSLGIVKGGPGSPAAPGMMALGPVSGEIEAAGPCPLVLVCACTKSEVFLALNDLLEDSLSPSTGTFAKCLPLEDMSFRYLTWDPKHGRDDPNQHESQLRSDSVKKQETKKRNGD